MADDGGSAGLEQYCLLAKTAKGRACVALILKVLADRKIFVFGELLAMPNIQGMKGTEHEAHLRLLEIFAYGTYGEYKAAAAAGGGGGVGALPPLVPAMADKLRMLTVVSLANASRVVPYATLQAALELDSVRVVEDIVLDAMYAGLLQCKLDQRAGTLRVQHVTPRDVRAEEIEGMLATLDAWASASQQALRGLNDGVRTARAAWEAEDAQQRATREKADEVKRTVRQQGRGGRGGGAVAAGDDDDYFGGGMGGFGGAESLLAGMAEGDLGGSRRGASGRAKRRGPAMFDARPRNK